MEPINDDKKQLTPDQDDPLIRVLCSMRKIEAELKQLNSHKLVEIYNAIYKLLFYQFLKGMAFGLGSVLGATIIVSILVYLLSTIEFLPIIGEWVQLITQEIKKQN